MTRVVMLLHACWMCQRSIVCLHHLHDITSNPCGILPFAVLSQSEKYMNKIECFKAVTLEMRNNKCVFQM